MKTAIEFGTVPHAFDLIDQIIGHMRQDNVPETEIVSNDVFNAKLLLLFNGRWKIHSPQGEYLLPQPVMINDILVKFARLADPSFQINVGLLELYEEYETYHKQSVRYVESRRSLFLQQFIERLIQILAGKQ